MMRRARGFTLTELAVVFTIVVLLLGGLMMTLSAQTEQRNFAETQRRLEDARDLLIAFAIVNGRLPCPATSATVYGDANPGAGTNGDEAPTGGGVCTGYLANNSVTPATGFLPARAIGFKPVDSYGYALDAWGNRIRYAVAQTAVQATSLTTSCTNQPGFTNPSPNLNMQKNGVGCVPQNLVICSAKQNTNAGATPPSCGTYGASGDARPVTNQGTVVAVVFSSGKNATLGTGGTDEGENTNNDGVFVWHEPRPAGATGGEYDDQMVWIPIGMLYERMIAAGVLP